MQNLNKLPLKLQEAHGAPIKQLCFNHVDSAVANLFATIGSNQVIVWNQRELDGPQVCTSCLQATIYDDTHMGRYISVVMQFTNAPTQHSAGGVSLGRPLLGLHQMELSAESQICCTPHSQMCTCLLPIS